MSVKLQDVDESNWHECVKLKVSEEEKSFVDSNVFPIAEWKFEPAKKLKAIYSESDLVGMLAYYYHDGAYGEFYWIYHLMIEPKQQSHGYGLTMSFGGAAQTTVAKVLSIIMSPLIKKSIIKALNKDLEEIKAFVENS